jgi:NitT/TauT family transport system substrate-binding protein
MKRILAAIAVLLLCAGQALAQGAKPAAPPTKVTIMFGGKAVVWGPAYVALDKGYFAQEGLEPEFTYASQGAASVIAALLNGQALMGFQGGPDAMNALGGGAPIRIVASTGNQLTLEFTASNALLQKTGVTARSPLAQRIAALKGTKVAIFTPGDTQSQLVNFVSKKYGLESSGIELVLTQNAANQLAAFQKGVVDVMFVSPPTGSQAESLGLGRIFMTVREIPELQGYPYLVGSASLKSLQERPQLVKAVIKAMARGMQLLRTDPEGAKASVRKEFANVDPKGFDDAFKALLTVIPPNPIPTREGYTVFQAFAREAPTKQPELPYERAMDPKLATEVTKELGQ